MTRHEFAEKIRIGHNLGNALECIEPVCGSHCVVTVDREITDINGYHDHRIVIRYPDDTYDYFYSYEEIWSNLPVQKEWFVKVKELGVQAVRIPINLSGHIVDDITHTVDPLWMKRIREVIDMAIESGLIVNLCLHTDFVIMFRSGSYLSLMDPTRDPKSDGVGRLMAVWKQMAEYVNDIPVEDLCFELTNEFRIYDVDADENATYNEDATQEEKATYASRLNKYLFDTIRSVGGNAAERFLLVGGYGNNPDVGHEVFVNAFKTDLDDKCLVTACYYCPWEFSVSGNHTTWEWRGEIPGIMNGYMQMLNNISAETGAPLIVTEYGVGCDDISMMCKDQFSIARYIFTVMKMMNDNNVPAFVWDPGYIVRRDQFTLGIPYWKEMIDGIYNNKPFDLYQSYTANADNFALGRLVHRTSKTIEDIQALDIIASTEE